MPAEGGLRGPGWGRDEVLERLRSGAPSLGSVLHGFLADWKGSEATATFNGLMHEVRAWRAADPAYDAQVGVFLARAPQAQRSIDDEDALWRERFAELYRAGETRLNRKRSAEAAGVPWTTVRNKLIKGAASFDPRLAELVAEVEEDLRDEARSDVALGQKTLRAIAEDDGNRDQAKAADALMRQSLSILERLEPQRWARQTSNQLLIGIHTESTMEAKRAAALKATTLTTLQITGGPKSAAIEEEEPIEAEVIE